MMFDHKDRLEDLKELDVFGHLIALMIINELSIIKDQRIASVTRWGNTQAIQGSLEQ